MQSIDFSFKHLKGKKAIRIAAHPQVDFSQNNCHVEIVNDDAPAAPVRELDSAVYIFQRNQAHSHSFDLPIVAENMTVRITPIIEVRPGQLSASPV